MHAEQELERRCRWELRRAAESAPLGVELRADRAGGVRTELFGEEIRRRRLLSGPRKRLPQLAGRAGHGPPALAVELRNRLEEVAERRHPVTRLGRVVRPAEERLAVGCQEDGHRPAALAGHRDDGVHVERIDVGPLLAIHLDVDEALVHEPRRFVVLERLVLHDVAPVARGVADREQDRLVLCARPVERLLAPGVPVDRVVGVLKQVRTGLSGETVHLRHASSGRAANDGPQHPASSGRQRKRCLGRAAAGTAGLSGPRRHGHLFVLGRRRLDAAARAARRPLWRFAPGSPPDPASAVR